jgi:hypothetical protein
MLAKRRAKKGVASSTTRCAGSNQATKVSGSTPGHFAEADKGVHLVHRLGDVLAQLERAGDLRVGDDPEQLGLGPQPPEQPVKQAPAVLRPVDRPPPAPGR